MEAWCNSDVMHQRMEGLAQRGLLRARTATMEWIVPDDEEMSSPPDDYIISFVHFHERELATPAHRFLQGLLHYYKIELQHLNPNGI
jgi:hypothetical protein